MIGEWFYIKHDETIAIFSAEHDKFITIDYAQAAAADVRPKTGAGAISGVSNPPILIFRPFQTVSVFTRLPVARSYLSLIPSFIPLCNHSGRWRRAFCSRRDLSSAIHSVSAHIQYNASLPAHTFLTLF
jgi:hypothetical protein